MSNKDQVITVDVSKLQEIIAGTVAATVAEMRKPAPPTAKELADLEQAQEQRRATAEGVKEKNRNKRWIQEHCTHFHKPNDAGGGTHCVYVYDNGITGSFNFIYCQKCEARIRPEEDALMRRLDPEALFDSAKFSLLMQSVSVNGAEILS